jgi:TolB-like protein/Tfp pilus assembly protein PilF
MSASNKAVFLSYASQDAEAARRICEALRAAGVEVWFDQSELRGGDAWDQKIRRQIRDCALFIPIISSNTQARTEGYFRLEWRLADQRTHLMAQSRAFLVPVCVDDTRDVDAEVPDSFLAVQWTRLPEGDIPAAFVERVLRLLSPDERIPLTPENSPARAAPPDALRASAPVAAKETIGNQTASRGARLALLLSVAAAIALGYFGVVRFLATKRVAESARPPTPAIQSDTSAASTIPDKSIAVLPFLNMSDDKSNEYFSDGLAEELIDLLAKIPGLHVTARTSSFYFKGKQTTIGDIAKALGVANVLEGSVRKSGNTLRVTTQLIRVDNGYQIWSETYDRKLDDIFKIQDDIAGSVVNALKVSLLGGQAPRASPTANSEAYTLYLQAHAIRYRANLPVDDAIATDYLKQALKLDPKFAPAWAELANNLAADYSTYGTLPYQQTRDQAHAAVEQALKLDPALPLAYVAKGRLLYQLDWSWDASEVAIKQAIALESGNAEAFRMGGYIATTLGHFDEAIELLKSAISLDPLQPWNYVAMGFASYRAGDLSEAERVYRKAIDLNPTGGKLHYLLGSVLIIRGQTAAALTEMEHETDSGYHQCGLALAYDALGRRSEADRALAVADKTFAGEKAYFIAVIYAARNQPDAAFAWLERALRQHDDGLLWIKGEPLLKNLVPDPRFKAFLQKMKLAE